MIDLYITLETIGEKKMRIVKLFKNDDEKEVLAVVRQDGEEPVYVPESLMTQELCLEAVRLDGDVLEDVPEHLRTAEVCLEAVRQDGWTLRYVPENLRTAELCLEAVKTVIRNLLEKVPEPLRGEVTRALKNGE